uniref:Related to ERG28-involved in synthesis of ergosterol n=1 Tax=Melanopsichium pennsylvanicum 4 TaxID=1398559 RepID=A0A077R6C6_9BASI|nr:related to ERG28-involved in synthesis of ergosterol [Melanopsichium pennsylvanicum 4]
MSSASEWIPDGLLPRWLLVVATMAALNGASNILNPDASVKVYSSAGGQSKFYVNIQFGPVPDSMPVGSS